MPPPRRGNKDANHNKVVAELRQLGFSVAETHALGYGFPDVCVGNTINFLVEIKNRRVWLTECEDRWHREWKGQVLIALDTKAIVKGMLDYCLHLQHELPRLIDQLEHALDALNDHEGSST